MIDWLRSCVEAIRELIDVWRLARWYHRLSDDQQEAELARITEIVNERKGRQGPQS